MDRNEVDSSSNNQINEHHQAEVAVPLLQPQLREEFEPEPEPGATTEETQMSSTSTQTGTGTGRWDLIGLSLVIVSIP